MLEVGPGKGALTKYITNYEDVKFKAVEADKNMSSYLLSNGIISGTQLINKDFLKMSLDRIFEGEQFSVIGNFPYNISSQILFRIEKYKDLVPLVVGMFQKEVAQRITSPEGSKSYGVISVLLGTAFDSKILFHVKPGNFFPVPKVTSSVIMLERKEDFHLSCNPGLFKSIVKASFGQRRKMLRNSLKPFLKDSDLLSLKIMEKRPEQLSIDDFCSLTDQIENI